jgi:hypothetical protein
VVIGAYDVAQAWNQRVFDSSAAVQLPALLQADGHRLLACSQDGAELDFCLPDGSGTVAISYTTPSGCSPCDLTRTDRNTGRAAVVARGLLQRPLFDPECHGNGTVDYGYVSVTQLQYPGDQSLQPELRVYFRGPLGPCEP